MGQSKDVNKVRYWAHKEYTKGRVDKAGNKIEFRLTFDEWLAIWESSGHYQDRGIRKGQYCMSRHNDLGHYEVGNVSIVPIEKNLSEASKGIPKNWKSPPKRVNKGVPMPQYIRDALNAACMKPVHTPLGDHKSVKDACIALNTNAHNLRRRMKRSPSEYYYL